MSSCLVFSLAASLGAMGELAGHERRGSLLWPGRSALIGLMGAALGLRRGDDFSALDSLKISVAIFRSGEPMRDFHTIQSVPSAAVKRPNSRPEALEAGKRRLTTSITLRDYRTGVFYGIAVEGEGLERLRDRLNKPYFTLYLGRKSCPLSAPPHAEVVQAETVEEALSRLEAPAWFADPVARTLVVENPEKENDKALRCEIVHDVPLDRQRWHFASRQVGLRDVEIVARGKSSCLSI